MNTNSSSVLNYGEVLYDFDPEKEYIYKLFDDYFNHPIMTKIKNINNCSMYMSKTYCLLTNECRYIVVFVYQDIMDNFRKEKLINLKWISLQTRTLSDQHSLPTHSYEVSNTNPLKKVLIKRIKVDKEASTYNCEKFPLTLSLLHTKNGFEEYSEHGNIVAALETYNTIIVFNN